MYNIYLLLISWRTIKLTLEQNVGGGGYLMENYPHNFLKGKGDFDYQFLNSFFHTLNRWTGNQYNHWKFEKFEGKSWYWETFAFILVVLKLLNSYEFTWHVLLSVILYSGFYFTPSLFFTCKRFQPILNSPKQS